MEIQTIHVHFDKILCEDYLGLNAIYHGFNYNREYALRGYTEADREREYEYVKACRLRIARTWFAPDYNCTEIGGVYDMHSQRMEAIRLWCEDMKQLGVEVALQAGWHFPDNTFLGRDTADPQKDPDRFGHWAAQTFSYLIRDCGLDNIRYAILFTEPTGYDAFEQEELRGISKWDYYVKTVRAVDKAFREAGIRDLLKFVGPNNSAGGIFLKEAVRDLNDVIDIYSGHDYNYNRQYHWENMARRMSQAVAETGKPFWMDEYGMQLDLLRDLPAYGSFLAQIVSASVCAGHQTSMIWTLMDQLFPNGTPLGVPHNVTDDGHHYINRDGFYDGIHHWGVITSPIDDMIGAGSPYPDWYAYMLLSRAFNGVPAEGRISSCAVEHATTAYGAAVRRKNGFAVLAANSIPRSMPVRVSGFPDGVPVYRHIFAPECRIPGYGVLAKPKKLFSENGTVTTELPVGGFVILSDREIL